MSSDKTRARVHWALNGHLVRLEAARRLASLCQRGRDTNAAHVVSLFKARWKMSRHIEMLRRRWQANGGRW